MDERRQTFRVLVEGSPSKSGEKGIKHSDGF
jgi:hypothetical protein